MRNPPQNESATPVDYVARVNRAIDHVLANLDQPLPLDVVAQAACFSPFHFHRVFRSLVGETLNQFVKRLRLERALRILSFDKSQSLTQVALACGFASSSDFSRSFKQRYGAPPSAFDVDAYRQQRRDEWQASVKDPHARHQLERLPPGQNPDNFTVQLRDLPPRTVAYVRVADSYRPGAAANATTHLMAWAEAHGVADNQWLGYMWDDPELVAQKDCRYDVAVEVDDVKPSGIVGRFDFPAMRVAQVKICGEMDLVVRALDWLFGTWLPSSGYVPSEQPCFEAWIGRPFAHGDRYFEVFAQLPVER